MSLGFRGNLDASDVDRFLVLMSSKAQEVKQDAKKTRVAEFRFFF